MVVVPCYRQASTIQDTLLSIEQQSCQKEIHLVDDEESVSKSLNFVNSSTKDQHVTIKFLQIVFFVMIYTNVNARLCHDTLQKVNSFLIQDINVLLCLSLRHVFRMMTRHTDYNKIHDIVELFKGLDTFMERVHLRFAIRTLQSICYVHTILNHQYGSRYSNKFVVWSKMRELKQIGSGCV